MTRAKISEWTVADYDRAAQWYCRRLPLEHFMEAISQSTQRKVTLESLDLLADLRRELKVPYYLIYYPEARDLQLHQRVGRRYQRVVANAVGRYAIPELELEVAVRDGWVRFWHCGELLPLPVELKAQRDEARQRAEQAEAEAARLREQIAQL